ncbi:MAG: hypothetical protein Q8Q42_02125 [Nanoarchaeota archaeon]|nr:hypothetical protein [Nanoarchaeota archaeon]
MTIKYLKLLGLSGLFLALFIGFAYADFTFSGSFDFDDNNLKPGQEYTEVLTLTNTYTDYNITNIGFTDYVPGDSGNPIETSDFDIDWSGLTYLGNGLFDKSKNVNVVFTVPDGIDAIDDDFDPVIFEGSLKLTGDVKNASNYSSGGSEVGTEEILVPVNVQIKNHLEFYNDRIEIEINDEDPINISRGGTKSPEIDKGMAITVSYKNNFGDDSFNFDSNNVQLEVFIDDNSVDSETGDESVGGGEIGTVSIDIDLDDYDAEEYDVRLELTGEDNHGGIHGETFEFKIDIQEEQYVPEETDDSDNDGVEDDMDLCPDTPTTCEVDEAGCKLKIYEDSNCLIIKRDNSEENKEIKLDTEKSVNNPVIKKENNGVKKEEITDKQTGGAGSFLFGLIIGVIGTALFFTLTKV